MEPKIFIATVGISAITILTSVGVLAGHNGTLLGTAMSVIGAIVGGVVGFEIGVKKS